MKHAILCLILSCASIANAQLLLSIKKNRPPEMDFSSYKQLAIGDIVGPLGIKNESSLDLTDELTAKLFNSKTFEIIDRNALVNILATSKSDIPIINETTTSSLNKKLNSAILLVGRLQNEVITQEQKSDNNGTTPCGKDYWWEAKYELTMQMKIIDVKTGNLLYSKPVTFSRNIESVKSCTITKKFSREVLAEQSISKLAEEVIKVVIPYVETIDLYFEEPALAILKNPLKKTETAITYLKSNQFEKGLEILKTYAEDKAMKDNTRAKAAFNYGLALYANNQYSEAKDQFNSAISLGLLSHRPNQMLEQIEKEKAFDNKLTKK